MTTLLARAMGLVSLSCGVLAFVPGSTPVSLHWEATTQRQAELQRHAAATANTSPDSSRLQTLATDRFAIKCFHHIEFFCGDATNLAARFKWGLGMDAVARSDLSTGNSLHATYVIGSGDLRFAFTAPLSKALAEQVAPEAKAGDEVMMSGTAPPFPSFDASAAQSFFNRHGVAGRAIGIEAYQACLAGGGQAVMQPTTLTDAHGSATIAEVAAYGDVILRFISTLTHLLLRSLPPITSYTGPFLPGFSDWSDGEAKGDGAVAAGGLYRIDHAVGNVWDLQESLDKIQGMTGMHHFAEFTAEDVGTVESGLNSVVLASDNEMVLLPLNEPTYGTKRKSQIQTYLEHNEGPGLQHLALKTDDIFSTMSLMRERTSQGGFSFQAPPPPTYYKNLASRVPTLTPHQVEQIEELGLLADMDDQGTLLQVFTKPCCDRPTFFIEIIQRIGCELLPEEEGGEVLQKPGCGGFGKGNFKALFESIEKYEKELGV
ncbi:unnamed protein product [Chrysoparadoxa australica]